MYRSISTNFYLISVTPVYGSIPFVRYFTGGQVNQYQVDSYVQTANGAELLKKGKGLPVIYSSPLTYFDVINGERRIYSAVQFELLNAIWETDFYQYNAQVDQVYVNIGKVNLRRDKPTDNVIPESIKYHVRTSEAYILRNQKGNFPTEAPSENLIEESIITTSSSTSTIEPSTPVLVPSPSPSNDTSPSPKPTNKKTLIAIIVGVIVLILIIVAIVMAICLNRKPKKPQAEPDTVIVDSTPGDSNNDVRSYISSENSKNAGKGSSSIGIGSSTAPPSGSIMGQSVMTVASDLGKSTLSNQTDGVRSMMSNKPSGIGVK